MLINDRNTNIPFQLVETPQKQKQTMTFFKHALAGFFLLFLIPLGAQDYILERLDPQINTFDYDEIAPRISQDGSQLYFTRVGYPEFERTIFENGIDLSSSLSEKEYLTQLQKIYSIISGTIVNDPVKSAFNQDVWLAQFSENGFEKLIHPGFPLNNALPNSISSFGRSDEEMIVINQFVEGGGMKKGFSRIFKKEDGSWSFPQGLKINDYHNSDADVNMTMSSNGEVIILAMERSDAIGRSDLYISFRQGSQWSRPKNLGAGVNSPWREGTPHLSDDGKTLYFSSDRGYQSRGGMDIFMQERLGESWENWSAPKRFRKPINSKAHDSHPYFCAATGHLYFNSTRDGSNDIYRIQIKEAKPLPVSFQIAKAKQQSKSNHSISVNVQPISSPILQHSSLSSKSKLLAITQLLDASITMQELSIGTKIEMDPIFFKQSTAQVLHKSYPALNQLSRFLNNNPSIHIRISGHTDNRGREIDLIQLSKERANAIKQFLVVKKGVNPNRIEIEGLGGHIPLTGNETEKGRRKNRRVEIEITKTNDASLGMQ